MLQPSNSRPAHNSADLDPFKFRWLIPISALQVRLGNPAGNCFMRYDARKSISVDFTVEWKERKDLGDNFWCLLFYRQGKRGQREVILLFLSRLLGESKCWWIAFSLPNAFHCFLIVSINSFQHFPFCLDTLKCIRKTDPQIYVFTNLEYSRKFLKVR